MTRLRRLAILAVALAAAGAAGTAMVQQGAGEPSRAEWLLEQGRPGEMAASLEGPDTAYVIVGLEAPRATARVSVTAPGGEEAYSGTLSTRMSVDYFMVEGPGVHEVRVELVSPSPSEVTVEVGQTLSAGTMWPAIILVAGVALGAVCAVAAIVRYITAQPDEKTL
ncbi:MAG: hypothetical protein OXU86_03880 [Thaumarchaeota archaeon]|nr:hypothetical protein [Nitrososphaerota archaeon]MDD9813941.1 hypothetical protein [Nitrososphaerota archaeon]MDD9825900.1 hypothetical protein [Nitrososphaerota archaeon]MDD9843737.1 hypothetical protein [Nitrososphaerota archaeon]